MAGEGEFVMVVDQTLGDGRYYVFARPLENNRFEVVSTGEKQERCPRKPLLLKLFMRSNNEYGMV